MFFISSNSPQPCRPSIWYTAIFCLNYFSFPNWFACLQSIFCPSVIVMCVQNANIIIVFSLKLYMALFCPQSTINPDYSLWLTSWSDPCLSLFRHPHNHLTQRTMLSPTGPCSLSGLACHAPSSALEHSSLLQLREFYPSWGKLPSDTVLLQDKCQVWVKCPYVFSLSYRTTFTSCNCELPIFVIAANLYYSPERKPLESKGLKECLWQCYFTTTCANEWMNSD